MALYDIIIKNGTVFDGKGNKPERVDIGIIGDEIKEIGNIKAGEGKSVIDASGKYVAPGFLDITNHSDTHWTLFTHPTQESLLRQGITTIIGGSCGVSLAPFLKEESLKDLERWADISEMNINWQTMGEFLDELDNREQVINFGTLVGLNTLKKNEEIKFLLKSSLEEGAFGVSVNFGSMINGQSMSNNEILDIFNSVKKYDSVLKCHLEDEGDNILPAVSHLIDMARTSGAKVHINHFKALGRSSWNYFQGAIEMIRNAKNEGVQITCDFFPYTKTGSDLLTLLPLWFRKMPSSEARKVLQGGKSKERESLLESLRQMTLHFDRIIIASTATEFGIAGKTVEQLATLSESSGEEIILRLLETNNLRVSIFNEVISEENIKKIGKEIFSVVSSDGVGYSPTEKDINDKEVRDLPHPRSFGTFPKAMNLFVKNEAILKWEELLYKMSGLPAEIMGIKDRGAVIEGRKADIIIFNPAEISDYSIYDKPYQYSKGVDCVIVNGVAVIENGIFTKRAAGKILRKK